MKRLNRKTAIGISVAFALLTAWVWNYSSNQRVVRARQAEQTHIVLVATAADDIKPRDVIRPDMVRFIEASSEEAPEGAFLSGNDVYGKVAQRMIPRGTAITRADARDRGPTLGLAFNLPENMRAVSVPLDPVSGVAGFLKPGDHVDVLATFSGNDIDVTRTVLQDVTLLAIGSRPINTTQYQNADGPAVQRGEDPNKATEEAPTATLAVWPDQAQSLVLAAAKARIHLALRPVDDVAPTPLAPTNTAQVFGAAAVASPPAPPVPVSARETAPPPTPYVPAAPAPQPVAPPPAPRPEPTPRPEEPAIIVVRGTQQSEVSVGN